MIIIGIDLPKATHAAATIDETDRMLDERTVAARSPIHIPILRLDPR